MRLAWHVACMGEKVNSCRIFLGKFERKRLLARPKLRVEDDFNIYLKEKCWEVGDWINLDLERDMQSVPVNMIMKF
jgi:hypothetical protein